MSFRQIASSSWPDRETQPILVLAVGLDDLQTRLGVTFDATNDDFGSGRVAVIETLTDRSVYGLFRYDHSPSAGVIVFRYESDDDARPDAEGVLAEIGLSTTDVEWFWSGWGWQAPDGSVFTP